MSGSLTDVVAQLGEELGHLFVVTVFYDVREVGQLRVDQFQASDGVRVEHELVPGASSCFMQAANTIVEAKGVPSE